QTRRVALAEKELTVVIDLDVRTAGDPGGAFGEREVVQLARHLAAAAAGAVGVTALDDPVLHAMEGLAVVEAGRRLRDEVRDGLRGLVRPERDGEAPAALELDGGGLLIGRGA